MDLLYPKIFASSIQSAFTTRSGGVSQAPYSSNNLAFHVGDDPINVIANHDRLAQKLEYDRHRLIHMRQIHSDIILEVDEHYDFNTPPECDALITNTPHLPLMVMSADCTPILIHDTHHHAIGVVHAGRAGALNRILPKTLERMQLVFGTDLNNVLVVLGPSIHGCCYEINASIAQEVVQSGYPPSLSSIDNKLFLDVNTILTIQLKELAISNENIEVIEECTSCHSKRYFSYRADQQRTGRIAGVIMLR